MTDPDPPRIEVTVAAAPEVIWRALRDPELIRRWHGWHMDDPGGLEEEIRVIYTTGVTEDPDAFVLEVEGGDRFSLHPAGDATVVRVTRAPRGADPDWAAYYDDITEGWRTFLEQLRFAVERHALAQRRTVTLEGQLADAGSLIEALGLSDVAELAPDTRYRATVTTGEELTGQVWARSARQLALTVDGYGDGLLVLAEQPATEHRPEGAALLVLTTYGLDDAEFEQVRARWSRWWEAHRRAILSPEHRNERTDRQG